MGKINEPELAYELKRYQNTEVALRKENNCKPYYIF